MAAKTQAQKELEAKEKGRLDRIKELETELAVLKTPDQPPQLDGQDIYILYELAQQATIKISELDLIQSTLDKCKVLMPKRK